MIPAPTALTGLPSADLVILEHSDDESLKALALCNRYLSDLCRDLWKNRLLRTYGPTLLDDKPDALGYREYYFSLDNSSTVAVGASHTMVLGKQGKVYAFGGNESGQWGLGDNVDRNIPTLVPFPKRIRNVACGGWHTIFLDFEGNLYASGYNGSGQLGLGDNEYRNVPTLVPFPNRIQRMACGIFHTIFLDVKGHVYAFGNNEYGQLGLGDNVNRDVPIVVPFPKRIQSVACGDSHTIFLDVEGHVYACGANQYGQLGLGDNEHRNVPTRVPFPFQKRIRDVACGSFHTMFLGAEGHVYASGDNDDGQLGLGDNEHRNVPTVVAFPFPNRIRDVACGSYYTIFLDVEGQVYACGHNEYGQLGLGDNEDRNVPTVVPFQKRIRDVACRSFHTIFLDMEGHVYDCGYNEYGQLGLGHNEDRNVPTIIHGLMAKVY